MRRFVWEVSGSIEAVIDGTDYGARTRFVAGIPESGPQNRRCAVLGHYTSYLLHRTARAEETSEDRRMAGTMTASEFPAIASGCLVQAGRGAVRRRKISCESGRALEILGHAIEYLADECAHRGGTFTAHEGQIDAMQLLMEINREIYFACPEVPSFADRCWSLLHLRAA